jgi:hypothetical protein
VQGQRQLPGRGDGMRWYQIISNAFTNSLVRQPCRLGDKSWIRRRESPARLRERSSQNARKGLRSAALAEALKPLSCMHSLFLHSVLHSLIFWLIGIHASATLSDSIRHSYHSYQLLQNLDVLLCQVQYQISTEPNTISLIIQPYRWIHREREGYKATLT